MEVVSLTPFPAAARLWQARPGAFMVTFVCKATFVLGPGELELASEQQPIHEVDTPWSDSITSLYAASDLVPMKPRADVMLVGNAYAPPGVTMRRLSARIAVADVDKSVEVFCDRVLDRDGSLREGPPFSRMPLLYERAAGGAGSANPVGIAHDQRDEYGSVALPNLAPTGSRLGSGDVVAPAGFGPIAASWPGRAGRVGAKDGWSPEAWWERPLPAGLDAAFFNAAPMDRQPVTLKGNERVLLENLHPIHRRLEIMLPGLQLQAQLESPGGVRPAGLACDTLWIDTARDILTLTYRGRIALAGAQESGRIVISLKTRAEERTEHSSPRSTEEEATATGLKLLPFAPAVGGALPFRAPMRTEPALLEWSPPPPAQPLLTPLPTPALPPLAPPPRAVPDSPWAAGSSNVPGAGTIAPVVAAAAVPEASRPMVVPFAPARSLSREPEAVDLVLFDASSLPRIRRVPAWKEILAALEDRPLDVDEDDPAAAPDPTTIEDRREIIQIFLKGEPTDALGLEDAFARAVRDSGRYVAPVLLLSGDLLMPFDEIEALKATVATVTPLVGQDENLRASVDIAKQFLALPGLAASPAVAEGLTARVRDAWNQGKRTVPQGYLDTHTERALLEQRVYQRRQVLGGRKLRGLFQFPGGGNALVTYLPDSAAQQLPMYLRFKALMIVRVMLPVDQYEQGSFCLEVLALARVMATSRRPS